MRAWLTARGTALSAVPQPEGSLSVHAAGSRPARILLLGATALLGHGVLSSELALQGSIARQVATATGRGIDAQVIASVDYTVADARARIAVTDPDRYDVIVLVLGTTEAVLQVDPSEFAQELEATLALIEDAGIPVVVATIPQFSCRLSSRTPWARRVADRHAARLNNLLRHVVGVSPVATLVEFDATLAPDGDRFRSADTFTRWGRMFSPAITAALVDPARGCPEVRTSDERRRQRSLDGIEILDTSPEERFDQIVRSACQTFGARAAALSFLDHDRQWFKARHGFDLEEIPRRHSACEVTIARTGVFVVPDMLDDPRFANNPYVDGPEHLRFYAGYRIEAPDGEHIGALCIYDVRAREFSAHDAVLLRELALMAQDELWAGSPTMTAV